MTSDRRRLAAQLDGLTRAARSASAPGGIDGARLQPAWLENAEALVHRSISVRARRAGLVPAVTFPEELPIVQRRSEIAGAIAAHQVVVVCGETGSGKSTQLPKLLLGMGRGVSGAIAHTQPRRLAARGVAARVAEELGSRVGEVVGFKVRFTDQSGEGTLVKLMTDGILLAETQGDPLLERYDAIIIDEAHERSLNIDFLLGYLRQILPDRPDLKLVVTSATIDPQRLSDHFGGPGRCPVIEVSGRTYPIEQLYRPFDAADEDEREDTMEHRVVSAVGELLAHGPGDVLVFLPGEREIRETADLLAEAGWGSRGTEVVQLYARLSADEQSRVFSPHSGVRVVLATNVAETSITVPGIRYVVDTGLARISRYSPRTKVQRLPIEPISKASARQRAGRCGRVGPGVCVRLYSEEDFSARADFTEPEILRTNLASVILQMKSLGLGEPASFPFVQRPDDRLIADGYDTLAELGAMDEQHRLTPVGKLMSRLPVDPRVARMLIEARERRCLASVLIIASAMSIQDPRERPADRQQAADEAHAVHRDPSSDFLTLLNLWRFFREQQARLSGGQLRKLCRTNFLSFVRMREWQDVHRQLAEMVDDLGPAPGPAQAQPLSRTGAHRAAKPDSAEDRIHKSLLSGLLSSVGKRGDGFEYAGPRGNAFALHPGSALFRERPPWVMASELVRTTKLYARTLAAIRPEWIEELGGHLLKRSYSDPHYDDRTGRVMAFMKATLAGLEVVERRRVHYGPIKPVEARQIFIEHGLAQQKWESRGKFHRHNRELLLRVAEVAAKLRRPELAHDTSGVAAFFEARLPAEVHNGEAFERWRTEAERTNERLLFLAEADVLPGGLAELAERQFPDELALGSASVRLSYRSDPAAPDDGVTVTVPIELLPALDGHRLDWLVPGLLVEKVEWLIKSLPKALRVNFVPTPRAAERCAAEIEPRRDKGVRLLDAVALALSGPGVEVSPEMFDAESMPAHLRMNIRVTDAQGRVVEGGEGRELGLLRKALASRLARSLGDLPEQEFNRSGLTSWDFGDLPETVEVRAAGSSGGVLLRVYPALADEGERAALRPFVSAHAASNSHPSGCARLAAVYVRDELARALKWVGELDQLAVLYAAGAVGSSGGGRSGKAASAGLRAEFRVSLADLIAARSFFAGGGMVRTGAEFEARIAAGLPRLEEVAEQAAALAGRVLRARQAALVALSEAGARGAALEHLRADVADQIARLTPPKFLSTTPVEWLVEMPRYFRAIETRVARACAGAAAAERDAANTERVRPWEGVLAQLQAKSFEEMPRDAAQAVEFRWMLEEYRVSLFAQELGTRSPVSPQRLERQWGAVFAVGG